MAFFWPQSLLDVLIDFAIINTIVNVINSSEEAGEFSESG